MARLASATGTPSVPDLPPTDHRPSAKILIVDDDERNALALRTVLEALNEIIVIARSGEEALRCLLDDDFAVILLDVHMPGLSGFETATLIRRRAKSRHIPIIFLTAYSRDEVSLFQGYSTGAVDFVFKPIEPLILRSKIAVFVELFRKTAEVQRQGELKQKLQEENFRVRTEKLLAERALRRSRKREEMIIQMLPLALYTSSIAPPFPVGFVTDNVERITGFPPDRFLDDPEFWIGRVHPADREAVVGRIAAITETGSFSIEYRWMCADGHYRTFLNQAVLATGEDGRIELFGTWSDTTERRMLEQKLLQAQKMEAVGQLTGGIAHDFNNMLTVVIGSLDRLARKVSDGPARRQADIALQGALRCADLTRQLLAFSRRQPLRPQVIDVAGLVDGMAEMLRRTLDDSIVIDIGAAEGLWPAVSDGSQVEAALLNLVVNARDAMPDGGRIVIRTENVTLPPAVSAEGAPEPGGDFVRITVADTGCGMPPEVQERIFEPFFTTKQVGQGTGLGLSMIYGFMKQSGGRIEVTSAVDEGTTICLYLPRALDGTPIVDAPGPVDDLPRAASGELVLVVEDDDDVRRVGSASLRDLGYEVIEAEHADAALALLQAGGTPDLLFTDIAMPGSMNGFELAEWAAAERPDLKVLYTSAYADLKGRPRPPSFVEKPYRDYELALAVRRALDGGA